MQSTHRIIPAAKETDLSLERQHLEMLLECVLDNGETYDLDHLFTLNPAQLRTELMIESVSLKQVHRLKEMYREEVYSREKHMERLQAETRKLKSELRSLTYTVQRLQSAGGMPWIYVEKQGWPDIEEQVLMCRQGRVRDGALLDKERVIFENRVYVIAESGINKWMYYPDEND